MRVNKFGNTGLLVSELALGTMTFGSQGMWKSFGGLGQREAEELIGVAIDAGINLIDTADAYSSGGSEEIIGQAIKKLKIRRDNIVIATKGLVHVSPHCNTGGMSRYHLMNAVKASLQRLQLDHIDLYQLHAFDPITPIEEALRALDQMVRDGVVRYIGVSNWAAWQVAKAMGVTERLGLARIDSLQAYYTVATRDIEREIVPMIQSEKVALLIWSPLGGGILSGKYRQDLLTDTPTRRTSFEFPPVHKEHAEACIAVMKSFADDKCVSIAQIALAWLLHQPTVTSVLIGARNLNQLRDNIAASSVVLTSDQVASISKIAPPPPEYPGWMMELAAQGRLQQRPR